MINLITQESAAGQKIEAKVATIRDVYGDEFVRENVSVKLKTLNFETNPNTPGAKPIVGLPGLATIEHKFYVIPEYGPIKIPAEMGVVIDYLGDISDVNPGLVIDELYDKNDYRFCLFEDPHADPKDISIVCYEHVPGICTIHSLLVSGKEFPLIFTCKHLATEATECTITPRIREELKLAKSEKLSDSFKPAERSWVPDPAKVVVFISAKIQNS